MKRLDKSFKDKDNTGLDFAVHIQSQKEPKDLIFVLERTTKRAVFSAYLYILQKCAQNHNMIFLIFYNSL